MSEVRRYVDPQRPRPAFLRLVDEAEGPEDTHVETHEPRERRRPHPSIAGRAEVRGDLITSVPDTDWDLLT